MSGSFDFALIGGQSSGGSDAVFSEKAQRVTVSSAEETFEGRGFLAITPTDPLRRPHGHVRLGTNAMDCIALNSRVKNDAVSFFRYRGPLYEGDAQVPIDVEHECDVIVGGYHFVGGEGVRASIVAVMVPPAHA